MKSLNVSILLLAVASATLTVGCGGTSSDTRAEDGTKPDTTLDGLEACSASSTASAMPDTVDAYYAVAEGAWLGCPSYEEASNRTTSGPEELGIELSKDGTYALLVRADAGGVAVSTVDDQKGTWYATDMDGMTATSLMMAVPDSEGSGISFFRPTFHPDAHQLRIGEGTWLFHWTRYVFVSLP